MKKNDTPFKRPRTAIEVTLEAEDLESFGYALRDWQHELKRINNRPQLIKCFASPPRLLQERFPQGDVADAYLAGYVDFLSDIAQIQRPLWTSSPNRIARDPWFSSPDRKRLLVVSPIPFREKNIFAEPENVIHLRRGRPEVSLAQKREKNRIRQKHYRARTKKRLADDHS